MNALILTADGFEDSELLVPYYRLQEAGWTVDIASVQRGVIRGKHGYEVQANKALSELDPDDHDLLVLPGGKAPSVLRAQARARGIAQAFFAANKPVAAICHGPQTLVAARILHGRKVTGAASIADELRQGGARYVDAEVVVDGNLVTSRKPADLPAFMRETMKLVQPGATTAKARPSRGSASSAVS